MVIPSSEKLTSFRSRRRLQMTLHRNPQTPPPPQQLPPPPDQPPPYHGPPIQPPPPRRGGTEPPKKMRASKPRRGKNIKKAKIIAQITQVPKPETGELSDSGAGAATPERVVSVTF